MKQGPGRDGVRGGTPSASGMSGGASRAKPTRQSRIFNSENMGALRRVPTVKYSGQSRIAFRAQERAKQQAAAKAERDKLARSLGRDTKPKKNTISTNTELNRMTEQSLKRRAANERMNKAKRTGTKAGVSAAGAGAVAGALPKKKAAGAEGPKRSMPRNAPKKAAGAPAKKLKPLPRYS